MTVFAAVGWVGTIGVLVVYLYSSRTGRMRPFHVANVIGAVLLVISDIPVRAWPALALSAAFGMIGTYGIIVECRSQSQSPGDGIERLWDVKHPYYCEAGNFYKTGCVSEFDSWAKFVEGGRWGADPEMDLLFRWDWNRSENGPDYLSLNYMGQRKGQYSTTIVGVTAGDEPTVRAWLNVRFGNVLDLWEPLVPATATRGHVAATEPA